MNKTIFLTMIISMLTVTMLASTPVTSVVFAEKIEGTDGNDGLPGTDDDDTIDSRDGNDINFGLAVALVDRSRPGVEEGCAEAIERHVSKVALIDANGREAATVSVRGAA